jgi:hypothetical protein
LSGCTYWQRVRFLSKLPHPSNKHQHAAAMHKPHHAICFP